MHMILRWLLYMLHATAASFGTYSDHTTFKLASIGMTMATCIVASSTLALAPTTTKAPSVPGRPGHIPESEYAHRPYMVGSAATRMWLFALPHSQQRSVGQYSLSSGPPGATPPARSSSSSSSAEPGVGHPVASSQYWTTYIRRFRSLVITKLPG